MTDRVNKATYRLLTAALAAFLVCTLPLPVQAEETYRLKRDFEFLLETQKRARERAREFESHDMDGNVPKLVEGLERWRGATRTPRNPLPPRTAKEAMTRLEDLGLEIGKLTVAVAQFNQSRADLVGTIARLSSNERRNRMHTAGWTPLLLGNLRLLRARSDSVQNEFWLVVAVVILESQVTQLDQRLRQSINHGRMTQMLNSRQREMDRYRLDLRRNLDDIRADLGVIREKAKFEIGMKS
jgi:hypothetical protein